MSAPAGHDLVGGAAIAEIAALFTASAAYHLKVLAFAEECIVDRHLEED